MRWCFSRDIFFLNKEPVKPSKWAKHTFLIGQRWHREFQLFLSFLLLVFFSAPLKAFYCYHTTTRMSCNKVIICFVYTDKYWLDSIFFIPSTIRILSHIEYLIELTYILNQLYNNIVFKKAINLFICAFEWLPDRKSTLPILSLLYIFSLFVSGWFVART